MPIPLRDVLAHPGVSDAEPELLTGDDAAEVRWVHSSEVLNIAHLLRGGELVLTAGIVLSTAGERRQRRYVRELAYRGVAAVAIEMQEDLPQPLLDEAAQHGFPVVRLHRTVPFVEVSERINGLLVNESVHRLHLADALSGELSERLTAGDDVQGLADALADRLQAQVCVCTVGTSAPVCAGDSTRGALHEAPITVRHVVAATLGVRPGPNTDPDMLEVALDRAPHSFALALLRSRASDVDNASVGALFRALDDPETAATSVPELLAATPLSDAGAFTAVVLPGEDVGHVQQVLHLRRRRVLTHLSAEGTLSVVALPAEHPDRARRELITDLREAAREQPVLLSVGPVTRRSAFLPRVVGQARSALELVPYAGATVVDATELAVERLVDELADQPALREFVDEQLGELGDLPSEQQDRMLETLVAFFDCAGNKTAAAQRLHLQRQTLYQRLDRLAAHLGHDVGTSPRPALQVAVRLAQAMRNVRERSR